MNILLIGGAGNVGTIIRPALEAEHTVYHYDLRPVPGVVPTRDGGRGYIASIDDEALLKHAMIGMDGVINLAMGVRPGPVIDLSDIDAVFNVNVRGCYKVLLAAQASGVRRIVMASSMSVFRGVGRRDAIDETTPVDAWNHYGVSKRVAETICGAAAQANPTMGIVSLRLMLPVNQEAFAKRPMTTPWIDAHGREQNWCYLGPRDTGRLFNAAIEFATNPGHHIFHASGEVEPKWFSCAKANEQMGWRARGE